MGNHSCDIFLINIWKCLYRDLGEYAALPKEAYRGVKTPKDLREFKYPSYLSSDVDAYTVKCVRQLEQLFTRHRFNSDVLSDHDLACTAYKKFMQTQERLGRQDFSQLSASTVLVVRRARRIVREILKDVPTDEEIYLSGSFSKRATTWSPLSKSYLHDKLKLITGSQQHLRWFTKMNHNYYLSNVMQRLGSVTQPVSALNVSFVPKSWKTYRTVTPNTLTGSYWSYGVGRIVADRLSDVGLNIHTLQHRQRLLAKESSLHGHLVTADLSAASDSFTSALINMLMPRQWYNLLSFGRIKHVSIVNPEKGKQKVKTYLSSFMAMGIGFTFPVQTLLFYALLRGIEEELGCRRGTISVYGDDLIYPTKLHQYVPKVFGELGFSLNLDKSFSTGSFRESCGGDFYKEIDVRPAMVNFPLNLDFNLEFLANAYKLYNALTARWDVVEIPSTLAFIEEYLTRHFGYLHVVPPHFSDHAGLKFADIPSRFVDKVRLVAVRGTVKPPGFDQGGYTQLRAVFSGLKEVTRGKHISWVEMEPYLWLKLKLLQDPWIEPLWARSPDQMWLQKDATWRDLKPSYDEQSSDVLYWRTVKLKIRGKKFRRLRAYTSLKVGSNLSETELTTIR